MGRVYEVYNKSTYFSQYACMCIQKPVRGQTENSLHQERTHSEWFSQSKFLELLTHFGIKRDKVFFEAKIEESEKVGSHRESN